LRDVIAERKQMRVVCISGTQDSGKTAVIKRLIAILSAKGKRSAVIVNDHGKEVFDDDFINRYQIQVENLRGG